MHLLLTSVSAPGLSLLVVFAHIHAWYLVISFASQRHEISIPPGQSGTALLYVDINNDSVVDALALSFSTGTVGWLPRLANGSFAPQITISSALNGVRGAVGDIIGNGLVDIVVTIQYINSIAWLPQQSVGQFGSPRVLAAMSCPGPLVVADFNGDGLDDIAVGSVCSSTVDIRLFMSTGSGQFESQVVLRNTYNAPINHIYAVDLDSDGNLDLVVELSLWSSGGGYSIIDLFRGNGDGTFASAVRLVARKYMRRTSSFTIGFADMNQNGLLDILVSFRWENFVNIYYNLGNMKFSSFRLATTITCNKGLFAFDVTETGFPDIICAQTNSILEIENFGDGNYGLPFSFPLVVSDVLSLGKVDMNNDGLSDLVVRTNANDHYWIEQIRKFILFPAQSIAIFVCCCEC